MYLRPLTLLAVFFVSLAEGQVEGDQPRHPAENSNNTESNDIDFSWRVIGGKTARPGQFLFVARLYLIFEYGQGICSGTVLSSRQILTAAHCLTNKRTKPYYAWVQLPTGNYLVNPEEMFVHHFYDDAFSNDIGLIQFKYNTLRDFGEPPLLPEDLIYPINPGSPAVVAGFGKTSDEGPVSQTLHYADVTIISNNLCRRSYGSVIKPSVMCTLNQGKNICGGDSGGPLLYTPRNGKRYIIGVNSFGSSFCESYTPSGYTRVKYFVNWIKTTG